MNFNYNIFIGIGFLATLALYKSYKWFQGGICTIIKDLKGKIIIVTGANTGIGKEAAHVLAKMGATVIFACRSEQRTIPVIENIKKSTKNENLFFMKLDLADFDKIKTFCDTFKKKFDRLDILINNAGLAHPNYQQTKQGFEMIFGTNHIGQFLLTNLLMDLIKQTPNSRIVNVSSRGHKRSNRLTQEILDKINDRQSFDTMMKQQVVYCIFLTYVFFVMNIPHMVEVVAIHPGRVKTEIGRYTFQNYKFLQVLYYLIYPLLIFGLKSPLNGAQTTIYCALEDLDKLKPAGYYQDCKEIKPFMHLIHDQDPQVLWDQSIKWTQQ